jgi:hypothetical protein
LLSTFTVTNTQDDGKGGSLRWAINQVNAGNGKKIDTIDFKIKGTGPFTIAPTSALPTIVNPVFIDGYSQPGASPNTQAGSDNAVIMIQLSGANAGFASGLEISAGGSTIRGLAINQFAKDGIRLFSGGNDSVAGNFLGTDPTGTVALPNGDAGVLVDGSNNTTIGGTVLPARNLVSGNTNTNVSLINNSANDLIEGNFVGLNVSGSSTLPNPGSGVSLFSASNNTIGGTALGAGNVIGGHHLDGLVLDQANSNLIQGNKIGTDPSGTIALGNGTGVLIGFSNSANNTLGGTTTGAGNLISGNFGDGVLLNPTLGPGNIIQGNLIGTDVHGTSSLANLGSGVEIAASNVQVGGTDPGAGNVISGNAQFGVLILPSFFFFTPANDNLVQGNLIGTDKTGAMPVGNGADGVAVLGQFIGASNNTIGGTISGAGNTIAYNANNGVTIGSFSSDSSSIDNPILSNSIFANGSLGIDLGDDGVTPNSPGVKFGPNQLQNFPSLIIAANFGSSVVVTGTLNAAPNTTYTIQVYGNVVADPSGFGQGQFLLGTLTLTTDSTGNGTFESALPPVPTGVSFVTATATDPQGNTSEFAQDIPLRAFTTPVAAQDDLYFTDINTTLTVPAPGVQANDIAANLGTFTSVLVSGASDGTVTLNGDGSLSYVPNTGFLGTDSFTYEDTQGSATSNVATVTIQVQPKTFVVTNTNDSGPGSLRQAITSANQSNSTPPDTIQFDVPGTGPFSINPLSALPMITHPTIIDGYSQPGTSPNTLSQGDNATILIQLDGSFAGFSIDGLTIAAGGSTVQGLAITHFDHAIQLTGLGSNVVAGNFLGTDPTGTFAEPNTFGVTIEDTGPDLIGGTSPGARNLLSGNFDFGVSILLGCASDQVLGNYIGTDSSGLHALGNFYGVLVLDAPQTAVGSPAPGGGNVISGNTFYGVFLGEDFANGQTPDNVSIQGNLIGTDETGENALGNGINGIIINAGANPVIGGTISGAGNVISGSGSDGVDIFSSALNPLIQGNLIGTDKSGSSPLPNAGSGLVVFANGATIGGTSAPARNVISGNQQSGISLQGSDNLVQNNLVGTDISGTSALGNGGDGVTISGFPAANNTIGGTDAGAGNIIAFNSQAGVSVLDPSGTGSDVGNAVLSNLIYGNSALGIDLGGDGVTPNHTGGLITGPNGFQNYPVLSSAVSSSTQTTISGSLNAAADTTFTIQFFANGSADPSGHGQGQNLVGSISETTDSNGNLSFAATIPVSLTAGQFISATATDPAGNTSEFSQDVAVTSAASAVRGLSAASNASGIDQAIESVSMGVIDETILNALAGQLISRSARRSH